jgi:hypothetical protein
MKRTFWYTQFLIQTGFRRSASWVAMILAWCQRCLACTLLMLHCAVQANDTTENYALATIEDVHNRVALAGGNTKGHLVFSLSWETQDDLDLHVKIPGGKSIYANNKRAENRKGKVLGELDVDMCLTASQCPERPVENIVFRRTVPVGKYKVSIRNYKFRPAAKQGIARSVPFNLVVRFGDVGQEVHHKVFGGLCTPAGLDGKESEVAVYEFKYSQKGIVKEIFEREAPDPSCSVGKIGGATPREGL